MGDTIFADILLLTSKVLSMILNLAVKPHDENNMFHMIIKVP